MTEREVFIAAFQKEDPTHRRNYLDEACAGHPELREQVENLLRLYEGAGSFLEEPAAESAATGAFQDAGNQATAREAPGAIIGPYKLIEQIGEGGMGTVWMAQQTEPLKRLVALKLIKAGMDSKQFIARFEAERQALALMDHPNIARVLDAGATSAGRPFFVMDLVKGVPITKYCDEHHLTPPQRLELFIPVCQAVQHAHQKGIIHRDLKPSNVLVALYDGVPVPKVIDFGVAKVAGQALTEKTLVTGFGNILGTLEYMSPEQAEINQLDIDTRSDIYSLGVLLYELLAGSPPFSRKELEKAGMLEMLRVIREQEPLKPSTKLSTAEGLPTLAANRGTEPAKLTKLVRGELDWIVMKALEKDRSRRYETANGFAIDVQRYLADEPVQACPPSVEYRFRKFARRNRVALTMAAIVTLAILAGSGVASWQAVRATRAEEQALRELEGKKRQFARAEANFLKTLEAVDKFLSEVGQKELASVPHFEHVRRRLLENALKFFEDFLEEKGDDPTVRFEAGLAHRRLGDIRKLLSQHPMAEDAYKKAVSLLDQLLSEEPGKASYQQELARAHHGRGVALLELGQRDAADQACREARRLQEELVASHQDHAGYQNDLATTCNALGLLWLREGRHREAEESLRHGAGILEGLIKRSPTNLEYFKSLIRGYGNQARLLGDTGKADEAATTYARAFEVAAAAIEQAANDQDLRSMRTTLEGNYALFLWQTAQSHPAEKAFRAAMANAENLVADFPSIPKYRLDLSGWNGNFAMMLLNDGRVSDAETHLTKAVAVMEKLVVDFPNVPSYHSSLGGALNNLASVLGRQKKHDQERATLERAIQAQRAAHALDPKDNVYREFLCNHLINLAKTLRESKAPAAEVDLANEQAVTEARRLAQDYPNVPDYQSRVGTALHSWAIEFANREKLEKSRELVEEAVSFFEKAHQGDAKNRFHLEVLYRASLLRADVAQKLGSQDAVAANRQWAQIVQKWVVLAPDAQIPPAAWERALAVMKDATDAAKDADAADGLFMALGHAHLGQKDEARRWYEKTVQRVERESSPRPDLLGLRTRVEQMLGLEVKNKP